MLAVLSCIFCTKHKNQVLRTKGQKTGDKKKIKQKNKPVSDLF